MTSWECSRKCGSGRCVRSDQKPFHIPFQTAFSFRPHVVPSPSHSRFVATISPPRTREFDEQRSKPCIKNPRHGGRDPVQEVAELNQPWPAYPRTLCHSDRTEPSRSHGRELSSPTPFISAVERPPLPHHRDGTMAMILRAMTSTEGRPGFYSFVRPPVYCRVS